MLVGPAGVVVEGEGSINQAGHCIHWPIHEARPTSSPRTHPHSVRHPVLCAARAIPPITQESCAFYDDHEIFDDEEVDVRSTDGGKRIAAALGGHQGGHPAQPWIAHRWPQTVDEAVGFYVLMERAAEAHMKAPDGIAIEHEAATRWHTATSAAIEQAGTSSNGCLHTYVPDLAVAG